MLGVTQSIFGKKGGQNFWSNLKTFRWPLLEDLLANQQIDYVDFALAEHLLKGHPKVEESIAVFICHLSISSRAGHLCVRIGENEVFPDPSDSWLATNEQEVEGKNLFLNKLPELRKLILEGSQKLPEHLVSDTNSSTAFPLTPICRFEDLYYLQRYWLVEKHFLMGFKDLLKSPVSLKLDEKKVQEKIATLQKQGKLLPEQAEAILSGCLQNFTMICGGPGTGKTYTAGHLLKIFWDSLSQEQRQNFRIALAAPTGKAASNLLTSIQKILPKGEDFPEVSAHTLHSLLGIRKTKIRQKQVNTLSADLLIVDESSMIDVNIMSRLMMALKPGSRLIFLGDRHQLPPVEAGSLFSDLVIFLQSSKKQKKHIVELKTCLRAELQEIVDLGAKINSGDSQGAFQLLTKSNSGIFWKPCESSKDAKKWQKELLDYSLPLFPYIKAPIEDPSQAFAAYNQFRLLAPLRKGMMGVDTLNTLFLKTFLENCKDEWFVSPIMIVKNDYHLDLFNGETGILVRKRADNKFKGSTEDYALFPGKGLEGVRTFPAMMLPKFEYAYCLSIYKSQGSEFNHVLIALSEGLTSFSRELLYTGVTRARRRLEIWSDETILNQVICRHMQRLSGIAKNLQKNDLIFINS